MDLADLTASGRLAHRTKAFLIKKGYGTTTAIEYVQGVISHFTACHRVKHPGAPVVVSGDFNSTGLELRKWSQLDGWAQPLDDLLTEDQLYNTYWAKAAERQEPGYQGTSRIDHFLIKNWDSMSAPSFTLFTGSYWAGLSDHRPLLC